MGAHLRGGESGGSLELDAAHPADDEDDDLPGPARILRRSGARFDRDSLVRRLAEEVCSEPALLLFYLQIWKQCSLM